MGKLRPKASISPIWDIFCPIPRTCPPQRHGRSHATQAGRNLARNDGPPIWAVAWHLGVMIMDFPALGIAEARPSGKTDALEEHEGCWTLPVDRDENSGAVARNRDSTMPRLFSIGLRLRNPRACGQAERMCSMYLGTSSICRLMVVASMRKRPSCPWKPRSQPTLPRLSSGSGIMSR